MDLIQKEGLEEVAKKVNAIWMDFPVNRTDIVARALEVMGEDYPNLLMFRGTNFKDDTLYQGADFAPGDLTVGISFAFYSPFEGSRTHPLMVMMKVRDVAREYALGNLTLEPATGGSDWWWRNAMVLRPNDQIKNKIVKIRKPPVNTQNEIILASDQTAIKI